MAKAAAIDYTDRQAVLDAVNALNAELAASGRMQSRWLADFMIDFVETKYGSPVLPVALVEVVLDAMQAGVIIGILAERHHWPLVGDVGGFSSIEEMLKAEHDGL